MPLTRFQQRIVLLRGDPVFIGSKTSHELVCVIPKNLPDNPILKDVLGLMPFREVLVRNRLFFPSAPRAAEYDQPSGQKRPHDGLLQGQIAPC